MAITLAGCGATFVSLLLFAGCKADGGPEERPQAPSVNVTTGATVATVTTTASGTAAGPATISIPAVDPPPRSSSSVDSGCGTEGVECTTTVTTSETATEPSAPAETTDEQPK